MVTSTHVQATFKVSTGFWAEIEIFHFSFKACS